MSHHQTYPASLWPLAENKAWHNRGKVYFVLQVQQPLELHESLLCAGDVVSTPSTLKTFK